MRLDAQRLDTVADAVGRLSRRFDEHCAAKQADALVRRFDNYVRVRGDAGFGEKIKGAVKKVGAGARTVAGHLISHSGPLRKGWTGEKEFRRAIKSGNRVPAALSAANNVASLAALPLGAWIPDSDPTYPKRKARVRGDAGLGEKVKGALKTGATKVGRGLQRASGPAALAGVAAGYAGHPHVGAPAIAGGFLAAKAGRALERAGSGSIKRTTLLGGPSTEDAKQWKKSGAFAKKETERLAPQKQAPSKKLAPFGQRLGAAVKQGGIGGGAKFVGKRVGRAVGNWDDRRRIKGERKELKWAIGGEEDAKAKGLKYAKEHGTVEPGYWAGEAKRRVKNIRGLEHSIKGRGDALPDVARRIGGAIKRAVPFSSTHISRAATRDKKAQTTAKAQHNQIVGKVIPNMARALAPSKEDLGRMIDRIPEHKATWKGGQRQTPGFGPGTDWHRPHKYSGKQLGRMIEGKKP